MRSCKETEVSGCSWIPNDMGVGFFVRLRKPNWIIFYITLLSSAMESEVPTSDSG